MSDPLDDTPPPEESEMAVQESLGRPLAGNPAERAEALSKRILYLENILERYLTRLEGQSEWSQADRDTIESLRRDLEEAVHQFREWQTQHEARN